MKGFIEVTERYDGFKVLYPIEKITAVVDGTNGTFIETGFDRKGVSTGIYAVETFDEIKAQLTQSEV